MVSFSCMLASAGVLQLLQIYNCILTHCLLGLWADSCLVTLHRTAFWWFDCLHCRCCIRLFLLLFRETLCVLSPPVALLQWTVVVFWMVLVFNLIFCVLSAIFVWTVLKLFLIAFRCDFFVVFVLLFYSFGELVISVERGFTLVQISFAIGAFSWF